MLDTATLDMKISEFKAELQQNPKSTVFVHLSDAYRQAGQLDDALEVALKGTWELPQFAAGFAAVGRVYLQRKVLSKAENAFYQALAIDQMCIPAYKGLARICKEQGDLAKASDVLTKAIMLDPGDVSLQKMIESLSVPSQQNVSVGTASTESIATAVTKEPAMDHSTGGMKPITTATIADIYIEQGLYDKAFQVYHELLVENPNDVSVQQKVSELKALMNSAIPQTETVTDSPLTASNPETVKPAAPSVGNDTVIDKLNGWLESIQARRNRV